MNFQAKFGLADIGDFEAFLDSEEALDELQVDYPELALADKRLVELIVSSDDLDGRRIISKKKELRTAAVLREKTRLTPLL